VVIEPGAINALVEAIFRLSKNAPLRTKMGRQARAMLDANFTRRQALQRWQNLLRDLDKSIETSLHGHTRAPPVKRVSH
jgi:glycosyltransferase involved in cell wall biosynthesis